MKPVISPFYPPRAGRSRYFHRALDGLRFWLHRRHLARDVTFYFPPAGTLLHCAVPGFGFRAAGWERGARLALAGWLLAFFVYVAWLGYGVANLAYGLMISLHASSILCTVGRNWPQPSLWRRLAVAVGTVLILGQVVYGTGQAILDRYCLTPLWSHGQSYIINRTPFFQELHRGDLVAFRIKAQTGVANVRAGAALDRIEGVPGDVIEFSATEFRVNGTGYPALPSMPVSGGLTLKKDVWLIWPGLSKTGHGLVPAEVVPAEVVPAEVVPAEVVPAEVVPAEVVADAMLAAALVSREDILGKPFHYWLWRHQNQ